MTLPKDPRSTSSSRPDPFPGEQVATAEAGSGRTLVHLALRRQGRDLVLQIVGGRAHVGAVAVSDGQRTELSVLPPHKEGPLARECAQRVARTAGATCCALAGIHQDAATPEEIAAIVANVHRALDRLLAETFPLTAGEET